jgi:hypothetical protein
MKKRRSNIFYSSEMDDFVRLLPFKRSMTDKRLRTIAVLFFGSVGFRFDSDVDVERSEEHTSELQSLS